MEKWGRGDRRVEKSVKTRGVQTNELVMGGREMGEECPGNFEVGKKRSEFFFALSRGRFVVLHSVPRSNNAPHVAPGACARWRGAPYIPERDKKQTRVRM